MKKLTMILALILAGLMRPGHADNVYYSALTFTAFENSASGVTIVAAVAGKTICVVGYGISTDSAATILIHHQGGAGVKSNTATGNIFGGGYFVAGGGESVQTVSPVLNGLLPNQPVTVDVSAAITTAIVWVRYRLL